MGRREGGYVNGEEGGGPCKWGGRGGYVNGEEGGGPCKWGGGRGAM